MIKLEEEVKQQIAISRKDIKYHCKGVFTSTHLPAFVPHTARIYKKIGFNFLYGVRLFARHNF